MYNKVILIGNLTKDIDLRYVTSGAAMAKGSIATSYKYKSNNEQKVEVCFLDFTLFGRSAEIANQYLNKGSKVMFEGRLLLEKWIGNDGQNRTKHSLRVETLKMLDSRNQEKDNHKPKRENPISYKENVEIDLDSIDEKEIPF